MSPGGFNLEDIPNAPLRCVVQLSEDLHKVKFLLRSHQKKSAGSPKSSKNDAKRPFANKVNFFN